MDAPAPIAPAPLYLEDLSVGMRFSAGPLAVEADEIVAHARRYDPQPFHLGEESARETLFGGLAASGWLTAGLTMRLITEAFPLAGGIIGAGGEIRWPRPTRPGDVLRVECEVSEIRASERDPDRGWITATTTTFNQKDEPVQVLVARLVAPRRPQGSTV